MSVKAEEQDDLVW